MFPSHDTHSMKMNFINMAEDVQNTIMELGIDHYNVIGHSLGGKVAMQLALNYSNISKVIVIDIGVKEYINNHKEILKTLENLDLSLYHSRLKIEENLITTIPNKSVVSLITKNLSRNAVGDGYHWKFNLRSIIKNYEFLVNSIKSHKKSNAEILFINGSLSDYILDEDKEGILKIFPIAKFSQIENAGHWIHVDQPEMLYKEVTDFLTN